MEIFGLIIFIIVIGFAAYVRLSNDDLAAALRAAFLGNKAKLANAIDDAVNRIESAKAKSGEQLASARAALITIKSQRKALESKRREASQKVDFYEQGANNAAALNKPQLVADALQQKSVHQAVLTETQSAWELILRKEQELETAVANLEKYIAGLDTQRTTLIARAKTAQTTLEITELVKGLKLDGGQSDMKRAEELVLEIENKAAATAEVAAMSGSNNLDEQLQALRDNDPTIDAEVQARLARYGHAVQRLETPAETSNGPAPVTDTAAPVIDSTTSGSTSAQ